MSTSTKKKKRPGEGRARKALAGILAAALMAAPSAPAVAIIDGAAIVASVNTLNAAMVAQFAAGFGLQSQAAQGEMQASGQIAQMQVEAQRVSTQMLARSNAETLHQTADYIAATVQSSHAYEGRIGFTAETIEVARSTCYEGLVNRTSGPERVYVYEDGSAGAASAIVADTAAAVAAEHRSAPGTTGHTAALDSLPDSIRSGRHYADGTALPLADLDYLSQASWLVQPGPPAGTDKASMMADQVRYGLPRQVLGSWYADLMPVSAGTAEGSDIVSRYPMEVLPVAAGPADGAGGSTPAVPGYALLRAAALSPWIGASPEDPQNIQATYSGYLLGLNASDLQREAIRLQVINNRLLYELLKWQRYDALLAAEAALRS